MPIETPTSIRDAYGQFEDWLKKQPYWLQDAAWQIYHGIEIDDVMIDSYVDMCIEEAGQKSCLYQYKYLSPQEAEVPSDGTAMSIISLTDISGVNALAPDARLDFSENGVTVVYGLNGAGKSGFMRIFKYLSGTPYEEPILPNAFSNSDIDDKSCKFQISQDGEVKEIICDLSERKETPLQNCDVFDTRISSRYISGPNVASYQPFIFSVLSELSKIADRIGKRIDMLSQSISEREVEIPTSYSECEEMKWIKELSFESAVPERYLSWTSDQDKKLIELPKSLDTENIQQRIQLLSSQQKAIEPVLNDLRSALAEIDRDAVEEKYQTLYDMESKLQIAQKLFSETADEYDKISVNVRDWKSLWAIAKRYYENYMFKTEGLHFGEDNSICPLCHQKITGDNFLRFKNVNDYVNGTCSDNYRAAEQAIKQLIDQIAVRKYSQDQIRNILSGIIDDDDIRNIESLYCKFAELKAVDKVEDAHALLNSIDPSSEVKVLAAAYNIVADEIQKLRISLQSEEQESKRNQLLSLQCHKWVFDNRSRIEGVIRNLSQLNTYEAAKRLTATNKITMEANSLANALITNAYINRFKREMEALAPGIKVHLERVPSKKGNSPFKISLDSENGNAYKPEDILSEGEQRIVALAEFFADATGRNQKTPIIIDDPISSLDYNFEDNATKRIVELAATRQVIVFTHRISLVVGIEDRCKAKGIPEKQYFIRSGYRGKGIPDLEGAYHGNVKSNLNSLVQKIAETKKKDQDTDEFSDAVGKICQQFRICVERSVEDELLFGMVKRFRRGIQTQNKTAKLAYIDADDCKMIDDMMTKYSAMEHSQPDETPPYYYPIDEIDADIKVFIGWLDGYRKKTNPKDRK